MAHSRPKRCPHLATADAGGQEALAAAARSDLDLFRGPGAARDRRQWPQPGWQAAQPAGVGWPGSGRWLADRPSCIRGNRRDAKTVPDVLRDLEERFGLKRVIFVGDRGMVTRQK